MQAPIVILHGWQKRGQDYHAIQTLFEQSGYTVFSPDMPGSGDVLLTKPVMHIDDYIAYVLTFLQKKKIKKAIFVCHSFGARVGAKLAATHPRVVTKLILTGAPLIRQRLSLKKRILVQVSRYTKKGLKLFFGEKRMRKVLYYLLGEWDYYKAPETIRETFKAVIAEDISPNLARISVPTLVIWGGQDTFVGQQVGKKIVSLMSQALYVEIPDATHKLPYEMPDVFARTVLDFLS